MGSTIVHEIAPPPAVGSRAARDILIAVRGHAPAGASRAPGTAVSRAGPARVLIARSPCAVLVVHGDDSPPRAPRGFPGLRLPWRAPARRGALL